MTSPAPDPSSPAAEAGPAQAAVAIRPTPPRRLVFGATGYVGSHLVPRLLRDGGPVRASGRNLKVLQARPWPGVELVEADALQPDTLPAALAGVHTAYYLVHSMAAGRDFGQLDLQAAEHFTAAAARAGVQRIVYLGGLMPEHAAHHRPQHESRDEGRPQQAEATGPFFGRGGVGHVGLGHARAASVWRRSARCWTPDRLATRAMRSCRHPRR